MICGPQVLAFDQPARLLQEGAPKSPQHPENTQGYEFASFASLSSLFSNRLRALCRALLRSFVGVQTSSLVFSCTRALFEKNTREGVGACTQEQFRAGKSGAQGKLR
jgi:hypothetical protein